MDPAPPRRVTLVPIDRRLAEALEDGPEAFARRMGPRLGAVADLAADAVRRTLAMPGAAPPRWGGFLVMDARTAAVVGTCAFKGAPDAVGTVEIAYFTFPPFEGQGYAAEMAAILLARAQEAPEVRRVIAHTLPERNASTRILEKIGLRHTGTVNDPRDGAVWRWEWERTTVPETRT